MEKLSGLAPLVLAKHEEEEQLQDLAMFLRGQVVATTSLMYGRKRVPDS